MRVKLADIFPTGVTLPSRYPWKKTNEAIIRFFYFFFLPLYFVPLPRNIAGGDGLLLYISIDLSFRAISLFMND